MSFLSFGFARHLHLSVRLNGLVHGASTERGAVYAIITSCYHPPASGDEAAASNALGAVSDTYLHFSATRSSVSPWSKLALRELTCCFLPLRWLMLPDIPAQAAPGARILVCAMQNILSEKKARYRSPQKPYGFPSCGVSMGGPGY